MNENQIKKDHPSICYECQNARKPASDENTKKGYVGCSVRSGKFPKDWDIIDAGKEVAEGWVDLRAKVFGQSSGLITNYQLITLEVKSCSEYSK